MNGTEIAASSSARTLTLVELAAGLADATLVGPHQLICSCPKCGGKAEIRDFGARRSFRCGTCGKLEEGDFLPPTEPASDEGTRPARSRLAHAIAYARHSMRVFPVHEIEPEGCSCGKLACSSAGKHPRIAGWQQLATCDENEIAAWWQAWPNANIGIACGEGSNLTVLDVDGEEGRATLHDLEMECGELPETPIAITGSGGEHRYFLFEPGLTNAVKFAPGLDVRTEGGLVVGVGSVTKQPYRWEAGFVLGEEGLAPQRMPGWLALKIKTATTPQSHGSLVLPEKILDGVRNDWLFKLTRSLKARGMSTAAITAAVQTENSSRCVPPYPDDELRALIEHATTAPDQKGFQAPAVQGAAQLPTVTGLVTLNVEQLLQRQTEPREFIVDPIIRAKDLVMIYSWRGVGKTLLALEMAYALASGGRCLKWNAPKPRRVLYIDGELPLEVIKERVAHLVAANDKEPPDASFLQFITPDVQDYPIPNLADPKAQAMLDQIIAEQKIEVLFIDSISTLCSAGRENEAESWLPIQEWALRLRRKGVAVIFVHHAGKGGAQRGTSRREDILDTVIHLLHPSDYHPEEGSRFEVHFEKNRSQWGESLRPFEARLEVRDGKAVWTMRDVEDLNRARATELFADGLSIRDVAEALGISKSAAARLKIRLKKESRE